MSYFTPDVIAREQLPGASALQTSAVAVSVGVFRPRLRRLPLTVFAVATCDLAVAKHTLTVQLFADLFEQLICKGLVSCELAHRIIEYVHTYGSLTHEVGVEGMVVAELQRRLGEAVQLTGTIDSWKTLLLLKTLEDM